MGEAVAGRQVATSNSLTTHSLMGKVKEEATVDKEGVTEEDMVVDLVTVVAPDNMTERVTRQHIRQEVRTRMWQKTKFDFKYFDSIFQISHFENVFGVHTSLDWKMKGGSSI
jgi:Asp-tRNA(Asn)/Glu-tRNA(Gln) amidotransferase B subunit